MDIFDLMQRYGYHETGDYSNQVEKAEEELSLSFAEDFRRLLLKYGQFEIGNHELTGVEFDNYLNVVVATKDERQYTHSDTEQMYVIENLGFDGLVIWQNTSGEIFQTVPNKLVKPEKIYSNLQDYFVNEVFV
jgi:hypothetical protein